MHRFLLYIQLYWAYLANSVKSRLSYREDFWAGFFANLMVQLIGVLFVTALFSKIPVIKGWGRYEVFFIYGFSQISFGLFFVLFSNLLELSERYVIEGHFDRLLLRPLGSFFQVITERVHLDESPTVILGLIMAAWAAGKMHIGFGGGGIAMAGFLLVCASLVYLGIFTMLVSLTFWFKDRGSLVSVMLNLSSFSKYPTPVFGPEIRLLLSWIIPFAFTAFYPAARFLGRAEFSGLALATPLVALGLLVAAAVVWRRGVSSYEGSGS
jgi:ABC-2 type transport system permease protein